MDFRLLVYFLAHASRQYFNTDMFYKIYLLLQFTVPN